jgi:high-affinity Fe2+/Pb2+ permease
MKIKLKRNQIFALAIAFIFIFYGLAQAIFQFSVNKKIVDNVSFILLIIAAGLIFSGRRKKSNNETQDMSEDKIEGKAEIISEDKTEDKTEGKI